MGSRVQSRVRFQITQWNYYTAEADNLSLRKSHVTAQALHLVPFCRLMSALE